MRSLLRRLRPRRDASQVAPGAEDTRVLPAAAEVGDAPDAAPVPAAGEPRPVPAGVAPEDLIGDRPDTRRRGRLRRRLRHLRQVRELMLRDIGGLLYEVHRAEGGHAEREHGMTLVSTKLDRLAALDAERRELETVLEDRRPETVLREPGVGGTCPSCGEYVASDARFCSRCGTRVDGRPDAAPEAPAAGPATVDADPPYSAPQDPATEVRR